MTWYSKRPAVSPQTGQRKQQKPRTAEPHMVLVARDRVYQSLLTGSLPSRFVFACICFCLTGFLLWHSAFAMPRPQVSVADYVRTTFTTRDGAPEKTWAIAQTNDGWLWFSGSAGLTRFDGKTFERVDVSTPDGRLSAAVSTIYALRSKGLVIGHLSGGVSLLRESTFTRFDSDLLRTMDRPIDFVEDADGIVWGTFAKGVMRFDGAHWTKVGPEWNLPSGPPDEVFVDAAGTLWIHTFEHISRLPRGAKKFDLVARVKEPGSFAQSTDGTLRFLALGKRFSVDDTWSGGSPAEPWRKSLHSYFDRSGNLWTHVGTSDLPSFAVTGLGSFATISAFFQDAENNVWIGESDKLHRLRPRTIVQVVEPEKTATGAPLLSWINLASDDKGTIWFTNFSSAIANVEAKGGLWSIAQGGVPIKADAVGPAYQVAADRNGRIWAASATGLWEHLPGEFARRSNIPDTDAPPLMAGLTAGCAGGLWMATFRHSLLRFDGASWQPKGGLSSLPQANPTSLHCDGARDLWLGYGDGRIARIDEASNVRFLPIVGPSIGAIASVSVGRHTLVGGARGLAILGAEGFRQISSRQNVLEGITGIVESPGGHVWLTSSRGLVRLWSSDLDEAARSGSLVRTELFDTDDGFPAPTYTLAFWTACLVLSKDDRIWFAGAGGLAYLDAARAPPAPQAPIVVFKTLAAGRTTFDIRGVPSLPTGTRNLEVTYTALRALHPERLRFRYKLDDVDDAWVEVEDRRQAIYTNLSPGLHHFHVDVSDELGSWVGRPSPLTFEIPPTFVQSRTFSALCVAMAIGLLAIAYRMRIRQLARRQEQLLVERYNERERIARNLHDTLLQGTQALIYNVEAETRRFAPDDPARARLQRALGSADELIAEGRQRIQDLRIATDGGTDLCTSLFRVGDELQRNHGGAFGTVVDGPVRPLAANVHDETFLIGREALLNAFQHARATSIECEIVFGDDAFIVRVRDDGVGMDPGTPQSSARAGHWGLRGLRERADAIRATCDVWSQLGAGTEVELRVPAALAYRDAGRRWRWSWLRRLGLDAAGRPA